MLIMSKQGDQAFPPPVVTEWPAPMHIPESSPQTPPATITRRGLIKGLFASAVAGSAITVLGERLYDAFYDQEPGAASNPDSPLPEVPGSKAKAEIEDIVTNRQESSKEKYEPKSEYALSDLAEYAQNTTFAEDSPGVLNDIAASVKDSLTKRDARSLAKEAVLDLTGRELTINHLPGTDEVLRDTRIDFDTLWYNEYLANFVLMLGKLPKRLLNQPSSYNTIEEFLPSKTSDGRDSVDPNIGGTVTHNVDSDVLSIDVNALNDFTTLAHELAHVGQFIRGDIEDSPYFRLRRWGAERFGSVADMMENLEQKRKAAMSSGDGSRAAEFDLAYGLIRNEDATPDVRYEDQAYTIGTTIKGGLLPENLDDELFTYLRQKQILALQELSQMAGADFGATIAFRERFTEFTHPKTLASVADSGVLNDISKLDAGPLSLGDTWTKTELTRGSYLVDIGAPGQPELVTLLAQNTLPNEADPANPSGLFDLYFTVEKQERSLDIEEVPITTTTVTETTKLDHEGAPAEQDYAPVPNQEEALALDVLHKFMPDIELGQFYTTSFGVPDKDMAPTRQIIRVTLDANVLSQRIKRDRLVGRINDDLLFEVA